MAATLIADSGGTAGRGTGTGPATGRLSPAAARRLNAEVLGDFLPDSGAGYFLGTLLEGTIELRESVSESRCMARDGFRYPPMSPAVAATGTFDNSQFPDLARMAREHSADGPPGPSGPVSGGGRSASVHSKYGRAEVRCSASASVPFAALEKAGWRLEGPWLPVVNRAVNSAAVRRTLPGLRSCSRQYGWPNGPYGWRSGPIKSLSDFVTWIGAQIDGAGTHGVSARRMNQLNRHWAMVFVTCARPLTSVYYRLLGRDRVTFLRRHRSQVTALEALARRTLARTRPLPSG